MSPGSARTWLQAECRGIGCVLFDLAARDVEGDPIAEHGVDALERQVDRSVRTEPERAEPIDQEVAGANVLHLANLVARHAPDVHARLDERCPGSRRRSTA